MKIPPGIKDGQKMRLRGMDKEGKNGGESGDLYLKGVFRRSLLKKIINFLRSRVTKNIF